MWKFVAIALLLHAAEMRAAPVRVVSWDLQPSAIAETNGFSAQYQSNLVQEAADTLKKLNPDVILLQQVRDWESCERLAKALQPENYSVAICSSLRDARNGSLSRAQVAILSKTKAYISWSQPWQNNPKSPAAPGGFAFAAIRLGNKNVGFFSTQLSDGSISDFEKDSSAAKERAREESARQLVEQINSLRNWTTNRLEVQVVAGNFDTSADDLKFVREKTVSRLEQFGFESAFAGLPLAKRVTLPGNKSRPDAAVDYIFTRGAGQVLNAQISQAALMEHWAMASDLDFNAPKKLPVVAAAAPAKVVAAQTNHPAIQSQPTPAKANAPAETEAPPFAWWVPAGVVGGLLVLLLGGIALSYRGRRKPGAKTSAPLAVERRVISPPSEQPPFVHVEVEGVIPTQSQWQSQTWQPQAGPAPAPVGRISDPVRESFFAWLKSKLVQRLFSDRAKLLETQQAAALKILAVDERLSKIERQIQERNLEYEQRIEALMKELEEAREENRELIRAKIALLKIEMEKNAGLRAAKK